MYANVYVPHMMEKKVISNTVLGKRTRQLKMIAYKMKFYCFIYLVGGESRSVKCILISYLRKI